MENVDCNNKTSWQTKHSTKLDSRLNNIQIPLDLITSSYELQNRKVMCNYFVFKTMCLRVLKFKTPLFVHASLEIQENIYKYIYIYISIVYLPLLQ